MRMVVIVLIGVVLGVAVARVRAHRDAPLPVEPPPAAGSETTSRSTWTRLANGRAPETPPQRELQPSDARYNPVALDEEEDGLRSAREIFEAEPRDPKFAPILEERIRATLPTVLRELSLEKQIRVMQIECRTLSCLTRLEVPSSEGRRVYQLFSGILLGDLQNPDLETSKSNPDVSYVILVSLNRPDARDEAYYKRRLEESTWPALEWAKERSRAEKEESTKQPGAAPPPEEPK